VVVPNITQANDRSVAGGTLLIRARGSARTLLYDNTTEDPAVQNLTIDVTSPRADLWAAHLTERGAIDDCSSPAGRDDRVVCWTGPIEQVYLTEVDVSLFFDR
jgi:hypothetical protein